MIDYETILHSLPELRPERPTYEPESIRDIRSSLGISAATAAAAFAQLAQAFRTLKQNSKPLNTKP
jgi:hypothetical protein